MDPKLLLLIALFKWDAIFFFFSNSSAYTVFCEIFIILVKTPTAHIPAAFSLYKIIYNFDWDLLMNYMHKRILLIKSNEKHIYVGLILGIWSKIKIRTKYQARRTTLSTALNEPKALSAFSMIWKLQCYLWSVWYSYSRVQNELTTKIQIFWG